MEKIKHANAIRNRLLKWFDSKTRELPWIDHGTPYHIWVSEVMLQQTQIATVLRYYHRFIKKYPNVRRLANAKIDDVLKSWEGLGYYRRARQMHLAANEICNKHNGKFPTSYEDVLALPGIGRYSVAAILSISLNQPHAILEGNTIRLFARLLRLKEDTGKTGTQKILWQFSDDLLDRRRPGDFNQAAMDLGREVCKPKNPMCDCCPVSSFCPTFVQGLQAEIPVKGNKVQYEDLQEAIVLIRRSGKFLMRKCMPGERWAGLWDFPRASISNTHSIDAIERSIKAETGLVTRIESLDKTIRHGVTKYRIRLDCFKASSVEGRLKTKTAFKWQTADNIEELPLSSTGRKFANMFVGKQ